MPSLAERTARLDALAQATTEWADKRTKELKARVATAKKILKGRTGAERLTASTVSAASDLVVDSITDFLAAEEKVL
jgi:hypothetical protein